ncbi:MAG: FAD binding domain-containing protein [Spirochaetia bacterium]|jgi:putative selenate reductase FAD-binding subunit
MIVEIRRPKTVREAVREKSAPGASYLGGGTWLNARPADGPVILVSLENLGLDGISLTDAGCDIGAAATFQQIADTHGVPCAVQDAVLLTASRTVRNMVTLGGELGLRPADSALIPALMALDAGVFVAGQKKPVSIGQLEHERPGALILSARVAAADRRCRLKTISRTAHGPRSIVVAASGRADGQVLREVRIIASDCTGQRVRLVELEKDLEGASLPETARLEKLTRSLFTPRADIHASADYKRYIVGVLVADAVHELAAAEDAV